MTLIYLPVGIGSVERRDLKRWEVERDYGEVE
jgi:hypothetical protein